MLYCLVGFYMDSVRSKLNSKPPLTKLSSCHAGLPPVTSLYFALSSIITVLPPCPDWSHLYSHLIMVVVAVPPPCSSASGPHLVCSQWHASFPTVPQGFRANNKRPLQWILSKWIVAIMINQSSENLHTQDGIYFSITVEENTCCSCRLIFVEPSPHVFMTVWH